MLNDSCVCTDHAAVRVRCSYPGWVRLAQLAIHAVDTLGSSCHEVGVAW